MALREEFVRSKIICTIGPVSQSTKVLDGMIRAGMDIARMNLSHGSYDWHNKVIRNLKELGGVSTLLDLPGPKLRIGELDEKITLKPGDKVRFTTRNENIDEHEIPINYKNLPREIDIGKSLYINDGIIEVKITSIDDDYQGFYGHIISGGDVISRKGINAPGAALTMRPPTERDLKGIEFGVKTEIDWFAMSFIRNSSDVEETRRAIELVGGDQPIISKIEHQDAIDNIDEIIEASDGIMVARGDLGIEVPPWDVPLLQKRIIAKSNKKGKPVIVATQMLKSMVVNPRPTRAETSDVANAIIDGADAVMLSEETALGYYPVESVKVINNISIPIEAEASSQKFMEPEKGIPIPDVIGSLVSWAAKTVKPAAIIVVTRSGFSARMVSKHRPKTRILAVTKNVKIGRRTRLYWGVEPLDVDWTDDRDKLLHGAVKQCFEKGILRNDDIIIIVSGSSLESPFKSIAGKITMNYLI
jgi:pyruvate kinase